MSRGVSVVIEDADGDLIEVETFLGDVFVTVTQRGMDASVILTIDQCSILIAAVTDAAKVVAGETK